MLKGKVQNYYFFNISNKKYDFNKITKMVKKYFEINKYYQKLLSKWGIFNFIKIIKNNNNKNKNKYFKILFKKLQNI